MINFSNVSVQIRFWSAFLKRGFRPGTRPTCPLPACRVGSLCLWRPWRSWRTSCGRCCVGRSPHRSPSAPFFFFHTEGIEFRQEVYARKNDSRFPLLPHSVGTLRSLLSRQSFPSSPLPLHPPLPPEIRVSMRGVQTI